MPVVQDGRLVGLLSRESIIRYQQVLQSLKMDEPQYAAYGKHCYPTSSHAQLRFSGFTG